MAQSRNLAGVAGARYLVLVETTAASLVMSLIVEAFALIKSVDVFFGFFAFEGVGLVNRLCVLRLYRDRCLSMMEILTPST